jgi:hypothetical protein
MEAAVRNEKEREGKLKCEQYEVTSLVGRKAVSTGW